MEVLNKHIELRRKMNAFYQDIFKDIEGVMVFTEPNSDYFSNHWLSCITIDSDKTGKTREDLRLALEQENIESRPLWKPMHLQPIFEKYPYYGGNVCEGLFENGLCLPSGSNLTIEDHNRLKEVFNSFF
jgi:dTDP-4-amino-4,6-dideoxygalactose transaminase